MDASSNKNPVLNYIFQLLFYIWCYYEITYQLAR